eukprot:UN3134
MPWTRHWRVSATSVHATKRLAAGPGAADANTGHPRSELVEELAGVVLLLDLLLANPALLLRAHVLLQPRLAVVRLEPSLLALLLQGVEARPGRHTAEEGLGVALGLIHVGGAPALVAVPLQPVLVLLDHLWVREALLGDLPLDIAELLVIAGSAKDLSELDLDGAKLVKQVVHLDALSILFVGRPQAVAQTLGPLRFLKALLADPVSVLGLQRVGAVPLLKHPVEPVASHRRPCRPAGSCLSDSQGP